MKTLTASLVIVLAGMSAAGHGAMTFPSAGRSLAFEANRACSSGKADAVHDLRVSIRRLTQCFRVYSQFLPPGGAKKVRQRLKAVMALASGVRDYDVALGLLRRVALQPQSSLPATLSAERTRAQRALAEELKRWAKRGFQKKWRSRLGL